MSEEVFFECHCLTHLSVVIQPGKIYRVTCPHCGRVYDVEIEDDETGVEE